jgi:hypothetical protein
MTDDAFINPELELQLHQSNIETGPDYDAVQLQQSIDRTDGLLDSIQEDTESIVALEAMAEFIRGKEVNKTTAILFNVATEGFGNLSSLNAPKVAFSLEGIQGESDKLSTQEVELAMENLAQNTAELIDRLGKGINEAMVAIGDIVHGFDRNLLSLKKRVSAFEAMLESIKDKEEMAYNYVKPENNYTYLMYTQDGFTNGIKPVMEDINWFLNEHADIVSDSVGKYKEWFNRNKDDINNSKVIDSLEFKRDDFLMSGSTVFNRSVGNKSPAKGCAFYRTKELPGGKCFYTQVRTQNQHGADVIEALMDVKYFMDYFEPDSFRTTEKRLYSAAALGVLAWASIMVASPLPLAMYAVASSHISDSTKVADVKKVRMTPETVFPTLSKEDLAHLLAELRKSITALEKWNRTVYVETWKDKSIQEAISNLTKTIEQTGSAGSGVKQIKQLAVALVSLMGKSYTRVHAHSFAVVNAALSYGEKSAKQYR